MYILISIKLNVSIMTFLHKKYIQDTCLNNLQSFNPLSYPLSRRATTTLRTKRLAFSLYTTLRLLRSILGARCVHKYVSRI